MDITLAQIIEFIIGLAALVVAVGTIYLGAIKPLSKALDKKIERISKPLNATVAQLTTTNGGTVGHFIESSDHTLKEINNSIQSLELYAKDNRISLLEIDRRIDRHLKEDHERRQIPDE